MRSVGKGGAVGGKLVERSVGWLVGWLVGWCAGHGAMIKCLQEKMETPDMGEECKKEVKRKEIRGAEGGRAGGG